MLDRIIFLLIKFAFGEEVEVMAMAYAMLIIKGRRNFSDVPERLKDEVREILIDLDCGKLIGE